MKTCLLCNGRMMHSLSLGELFSLNHSQPPSVCANCFAHFMALTERCKGCSRSFEEDDYCLDCYKWLAVYPLELVKHDAFFYYNDAMKDWLHAYKFKGDTRYAAVFQKTMQQFYRKHKHALFVPLPISGKSLESRGFNQCELILQEAHIPFTRLLVNSYQGEKQSEKNRFERLQTAQPFELIPNEIAKDQPIILFDDIYTTGRTLLHAKALLLENGFTQITSFSIAR